MASREATLPTDPMVHALLHEILAGLRELTSSGRPTRIDLRRLPLARDGFRTLREWLGDGEIAATMHGIGSCSFQETCISAVWWVVQRNAVEETVGEFIEIAMVPELLKAGREDVEAAVERLQAKLEPASPPK